MRRATEEIDRPVAEFELRGKALGHVGDKYVVPPSRSFMPILLGLHQKLPRYHGNRMVSSTCSPIRRSHDVNSEFECSYVDVLIIGAGPTGLGAAKRLHQLVSLFASVKLDGN